MCELVALSSEQMDNLQLLHLQKYGKEGEITCPGCLQALDAVINGSPSDREKLRVASGEHHKSPTTCLQVFWVMCLRLGKMYKNGNLGRKAHLTEKELKLAENGLSRASTAPGTPGTPGTPTYDQDDQVPDTQEGGSSSEVAAAEPEKKGRGRPAGSKNKTSKEERVRIQQKIGNMKLVAKDGIQAIAVISDAQLRYEAHPLCGMNVCMVCLGTNTFKTLTGNYS